MIFVSKPAWIVLVIACSLTCCAGVPAAAADDPTPPISDAPRLDKIVIDGNAADWGDGGLVVDILWATNDDMPDVTDSDASVRFAWDDRGLLVLVTVTDDQWHESDNDKVLWGSDCVELFMAPQRGVQEIVHWAIAPGMDADHPTPRHYDYHRFLTEALRQQSVAPLYARAKTDTGYVMEALMPWESMGVEPRLGEEIAAQVMVTDRDRPEDQPTHWVWSPSTGAFRDSNRMHRVRLSERPSAAEIVLIDSGYSLEDRKPNLIVTAEAEHAGREVTVVDGDESLATAPLAPEPGGRAKVKLLLPVPAAGQPYMGLSVRVDGDHVGGVDLPFSGGCAEVNRFIDAAGELRERYGVGRPWDDMALAPPVIRRHRGMVARALGLLDQAASVTLDELCELVSETMVMLDAIDAGEDYLGDRRNEFRSAYYSAADGSGQPFVAVVPVDYDPAVSYPLVVQLHGLGGRPAPDPSAVHTDPYLEVRPWGRGDLSYSALGERDVLAVIEYARRWYNVDPARIYLTGGSMGGGGTWLIASRYPDLFAAAAAECGWTAGAPLENLRHVPVLNQHGAKDWIVAIDHSRFGVYRLRSLGYSVTHIEYPDAGHSIFGLRRETDWLSDHRRPDRVATVTYTPHTPDEGSAYWLSIRRFIEPHRQARIQARFSPGADQTISLMADNVAVLELDIAAMGADPDAALIVETGFSHLTAPAPLPQRLFVIAEGDRRVLGSEWSAPVSPIRPYRPGAAAGLYTGEPLLIVRGTTGGADRTEMLHDAATMLSAFGGAGRLMAVGRIPVKTDAAVTDDDLEHFNLILLGTPDDNAIVARLADRLPWTINDSGELIAGGRRPVSLRGAGIRLAYYNPLSPKRLIYLIATDVEGEPAERWLSDPDILMTGAHGFDRGVQPDLVVQTIGGGDRRRMQFTRGWQWRTLGGDDRPIPEAMADPDRLSRVVARIIRRAVGTDFALAHIDRAPAGSVKELTLADVANETLSPHTLTGSVTGIELAEIHARWIADGILAVAPPLDPATLDGERMYRLAMPLRVCGTLAQRQKNLQSVQAGSVWHKSELWREVFAHTPRPDGTSVEAQP